MLFLIIFGLFSVVSSTENEEILFFLQEIWQLPMSIETTILGNYFIIPNETRTKIKEIFHTCKNRNVKQGTFELIQDKIIEMIENWKDHHTKSVFEEYFNQIKNMLDSADDVPGTSIEAVNYSTFEDEMDIYQTDFYKKLADTYIQKLPEICNKKIFILKISVDKILDRDTRIKWMDAVIESIRKFQGLHLESDLILLHLTYIFGLMTSFFEKRHKQIKSSSGGGSFSNVLQIEKGLSTLISPFPDSTIPDFTFPTILETRRIFNENTIEEIDSLYTCLLTHNIGKNEIDQIQIKLKSEISNYINGSSEQLIIQFLQDSVQSCKKLSPRTKKRKQESGSGELDISKLHKLHEEYNMSGGSSKDEDKTSSGAFVSKYRFPDTLNYPGDIETPATEKEISNYSLEERIRSIGGSETVSLIPRNLPDKQFFPFAPFATQFHSSTAGSKTKEEASPSLIQTPFLIYKQAQESHREPEASEGRGSPEAQASSTLMTTPEIIMSEAKEEAKEKDDTSRTSPRED